MVELKTSLTDCISVVLFNVRLILFCVNAGLILVVVRSTNQYETYTVPCAVYFVFLLYFATVFTANTDKEKKKQTDMAAPSRSSKDKSLVSVGIFTTENSTVNVSLSGGGRQTSEYQFEGCSPHSYTCLHLSWLVLFKNTAAVLDGLF